LRRTELREQPHQGKILQESTVKMNRAGFTLVEMAIVLVIVGLLLGGLLMPLSAQVEQRQIGETQKALEEIKEALIGFAIANGRLPCPATATIVSGAAGAGIENTPTATGCTGGQSGVLPWSTLGVNETDAWNWRYTYQVSSQFSRTVNPTLTVANFPGCTATTLPTTPLTQAAFALCSSGDNNVCPSNTGCPGTTIASTIPAIVVSHGKNGAGAYNTQGTLIPVSTDVDEAANSDGNTNFVSHTPTSTFDDIVIWVSPNILFNRMVTAGKLP
jgi:prepilin-type N-terminal cleavage/methylation domain-containing protein